MKYVIANLKSNKDLNTIKEYANSLSKIEKLKELIICPPSCFLPLFDSSNYLLGAQDLSMYQEGAYTGEINAKMLKSLNVKYVIVGHSERRTNFKEDNQVLISKIKNALFEEHKVILCIGESEEENQQELTNKVLENQIATILNDFTREDIKNIIIAYEPVWAIGSGRIPSIEEIEKTTQFIKNIIKDYYELELPVIYGGSVSLKNIDQLAKIKNIDGFLLGGSSLNIEELNQIACQYLK